MRTGEICKNGTENGTLSFRGIAQTPAVGVAPKAKSTKRLYRCMPAHFVPKDVARRIADLLSTGQKQGVDQGYAWHS
jgi:hypothetical protein